MIIIFFIIKFGLNNNIYNNISSKDDKIYIILIKDDIIDKFNFIGKANTIKNISLFIKGNNDNKSTINTTKVKFKKNI